MRTQTAGVASVYADAAKLLDAMRPMLTTLLGKEHAETVGNMIRRDVGI